MRRFFFVILALLEMLGPASWVAAQSDDSAGVEITAPSPSTPLQGTVTIEGSTIMEGFISWEITFGYASDSTGTWFLMAEGDEQVSSGELTQWDTTTITDGNYSLRLTVYVQGGRREHYVVNDLQSPQLFTNRNQHRDSHVNIYALHRNTSPQPDSHQHDPTNRYRHTQYTHAAAHQSGNDHAT